MFQPIDPATVVIMAQLFAFILVALSIGAVGYIIVVGFGRLIRFEEHFAEFMQRHGYEQQPVYTSGYGAMPDCELRWMKVK